MPLPQENRSTIEDYYNMPDHIHAELIHGQYYNMAPPNRINQKISLKLSNIIDSYINAKKGNCEVYAAPFSVQLDDNEPTIVEPDISVICDTSKLNERGCIGAPDWIMEIVSPSSIKHDYITKLWLYANAGVREYWIVDPQTKEVHIYHLEHSDFIAKNYTFHDVIKVGIYEDFSIDFASLELS